MGDLDSSNTHRKALRAFAAFFTFLNWERKLSSLLIVVRRGLFTNPASHSQG